GLLAVIVIILLIIFQPGRGDDPAASAPPTEPAETPSSSPDVEAAACDPLDLLLEPVTDKNSYAAGEQPQISMRVTNESASACAVNLGSTEQEFRITSGSDSIWSSRDCQTGAVDAVRTVEAGASIDLPAIPWDRTRSSTTTCDSTRSPVVAGGASYHLRVYLGDLESEGTQQFILN
ncbi:MAG TPA: hypothetical protein PK890_02800, partial [Terrimesophilobacter sp.]|nr:hypothetical protein [Terrimesophilobacter sp.]